MKYDGYIVISNADGGMNMLMFKAKKDAKKFVEEQTARTPDFPPLMHGFDFVPEGVDLVQ